MKYAIIGDHDGTRAAALKAVLKRRYDIEVNVELAWDALQVRLQQSRRLDQPIEVVVLDYRLPGPEDGKRTLSERVGYLRMAHEFGLNRPVVVTADNPKFAWPFEEPPIPPAELLNFLSPLLPDAE